MVIYYQLLIFSFKNYRRFFYVKEVDDVLNALVAVNASFPERFSILVRWKIIVCVLATVLKTKYSWAYNGSHVKIRLADNIK